jgi:hypothetical protein
MAQIQQVTSFDELPAALSIWPDLGRALGISRASAYKLARSKGFPCVKVTERKHIIPKDLFLKYLEEKTDVEAN